MIAALKLDRYYKTQIKLLSRVKLKTSCERINSTTKSIHRYKYKNMQI